MQSARIIIDIKEDVIVIGIETLHLAGAVQNEDEAVATVLPKRSILQMMLNKFSYGKEAEVAKALHSCNVSTYHHIFNNEGAQIRADLAREQYILPVSPWLALDFLSAVDTYFSEFQTESVKLGGQCLFDKLLADNVSMTVNEIEGYLRSGAVVCDISIALAEKIIELGAGLPNYQLTCLALQGALQYSQRSSTLTFKDCLDTRGRLVMLAETEPDKFPFHAQSMARERTEFLHQLVKKMLRTNRKDELHHLLRNISRLSKRKLFEACLGKAAFNRQLYSWASPEWSVLKAANFYIRPDEKVGIKLGQNAGYLAYYAEDKPHHDVAESELRFFGDLVGLQFDPASNFHQELIFTEACSYRLKSEGFHLTPHYIKKLQSMVNYASLFKRVVQEFSGGAYAAFPLDLYGIISRHIHFKGTKDQLTREMEVANEVGWRLPCLPQSEAEPVHKKLKN